MEPREEFQGVICCCLDERSVKDTIHKLLDLKDSSDSRNAIHHYNLELKNKYYQATLQLVDYADLFPKDNIPHSNILSDCHAIILFGNGEKLTTDQLDSKVEELSEVGGEPRVLLHDGLDVNNSLQDWSIKNGYNLIDVTDEEAGSQLIDSLSAFKWKYRSDKTDETPDEPKLNDELMKKLSDFDTLLSKLSAYRERPELRGNPDDKNIVEIADLLSGLLGDDVDEEDFLETGEADSKPNNK